MNLFVDTSVWSLALRRDAPPDLPQVRRLRDALVGDAVHTSGLVLQELLQDEPAVEPAPDRWRRVAIDRRAVAVMRSAALRYH